MIEDEGHVQFTTGDLLEMIAILSNAVVSQGTAIRHLTADRREDARAAADTAGEKVDELLDFFRRKIGPESVTDER